MTVVRGACILIKDRSNHPCARIKLHISRITPEEISEIEVHAIGGNVIVIKQQVEFESNGLIIELTARPEIRFYLSHYKYGDSNPVNLYLEGDREYWMEACNETKLSITVSFSNVGSEVYMDDVFFLIDQNTLESQTFLESQQGSSHIDENEIKSLLEKLESNNFHII